MFIRASVVTALTLSPCVLQLYDVVVPLLTDAALPPPLLGVALLCVAELCTALRAHSISKLSAFIPPLLEILKKHQVLLK